MLAPHADLLGAHVPLGIIDPFLYLEADGRRAATVSVLEADKVSALGIEVIEPDRLGIDDLIAAGSLPAARAAGKARIEGKDYVMRDGDVVEFRFQTTSGGKAAH